MAILASKPAWKSGILVDRVNLSVRGSISSDIGNKGDVGFSEVRDGVIPDQLSAVGKRGRDKLNGGADPTSFSYSFLTPNDPLRCSIPGGYFLYRKLLNGIANSAIHLSS